MLLLPPSFGILNFYIFTKRHLPGIVRNWRVLWRSISAPLRRESLLLAFRESLQRFRAMHPYRNVSEWRMEYTVLGVGLLFACSTDR